MPSNRTKKVTGTFTPTQQLDDVATQALIQKIVIDGNQTSNLISTLISQNTMMFQTLYAQNMEYFKLFSKFVNPDENKDETKFQRQISNLTKLKLLEAMAKQIPPPPSPSEETTENKG